MTWTARNPIERLFCRLKNPRRIAGRYDRLPCNYLAGLALIAVTAEWTKCVLYLSSIGLRRRGDVPVPNALARRCLSLRRLP